MAKFCSEDEQIFLIGGDNDEMENHALMQAIRSRRTSVRSTTSRR